MLNNIGKSVRYGAPRDVERRGGAQHAGKIIDEVWAEPNLHDSQPHSPSCKGRPDENGHCWGDYAFCSQLIEWESGRRSIRLAYYRRRCGESNWQYASQMTVDSFPDTVKMLLEKTLAKEDWFAATGSSEVKTNWFWPRLRSLPAVAQARR